MFEENLFTAVQENNELFDTYDPHRIISIVCRINDVSILELKRKTRKREIVLTRQLCHYFLKSLTKLSLEKIGNMAGEKDHATVLYSCKTVTNLIETSIISSGKFHRMIDKIHNEIHGIVSISEQSQLLLPEEPKTDDPISSVPIVEKKPWTKPSIRKLPPAPITKKKDLPQELLEPKKQIHTSWDVILRKKTYYYKKDLFVESCF